MDHGDRQVLREQISRSFAERLGRYQQAQRDLMDSLRDPDMSVEAFERLSGELFEEINNLKRLKVELQQRRDELSAYDVSSVSTS